MSLTDEKVELAVKRTATEFGYRVGRVGVEHYQSNENSSEIEHDAVEDDVIEEVILRLDASIRTPKQLREELVYHLGQIRFEARHPLLAKILLPLFGEKIAYRERRRLGIEVVPYS